MTGPDAVAATARLRSRLVRAMVRGGALTDPDWQEAFLNVPRHVFLPRYFQQQAGRWTAVDSTDPDWLPPVYADRVLVTQLDGDSARWDVARGRGPVTGSPTCSSSMPTIMAVMLEALRVRPGARVLEIGTGTGYNAALLCARLGDGLVTTVDVDRTLAEPARQRLAAIGFHPSCAVAEGTGGYPPDAPYDRVLCTCAVPEIPLPWLAQTNPGGLVVTTLSRPLGAGLVRITVGEGATGTGRVLADDGRFMPLRAAESRRVPWPSPEATGSVRRTTLPPSVISPTNPFEFFAGLDVPGVHAVGSAGDGVVLAHEDGSWARHRGDTVTQGGPRRLWDDIEIAHERWLRLGQPRRARFGVTVSPEAQEIWLDLPDSPHRWPLGADPGSW